MARIGPLAPGRSFTTIAQRLAPVADRIRQLNTNMGVRPYRCFLTWTRFGGERRGEGDEHVVQRLEVLPTPKVASLDSTTFSLFHAGTVPVGSVKVTEISSARWTEDLLRGLDPCAVPSLARAPAHGSPPPKDAGIPEPYDFFWEVVEDDRAGPDPTRFRYRLMNKPFRLPGRAMWTVMLEKTSEDRRRDDTSAFGPAPALPGGWPR